ncbi:MAG: ABC transporter permease [Oscillospiraceae bacterium]|nr:ABC transporter permease [Oscillospiraceae bacterium]
MRSIRRNMRLITLMLLAFCIGMVILVVKIYKESSFYIVNSTNAVLGKVYDRNGDVLFDQKATPETYGYDHFTDIANLIGNDSRQMTNTLVSENIEFLSNYSFSLGIKGSDGHSSIHTTIDHAANKAVYNAYGSKNGAAIAYNYITGEILVCVSKPGLNPFGGYVGLEEGSLLCKAFYKFTPGSTQKVSTLAVAHEMYGADLLLSKSYHCSGGYMNTGGTTIYCHNRYGHGFQNIDAGFANSCNPFFAQLVEDPDFNLETSFELLKKMGYSVNGSAPYRLEINNMSVQTASTNLTDKSDFSTQWGFIGQGETMVSPCMLMMWQSAIATGTGKAAVPYLIQYTTRVDGTPDNHAVNSVTDEFFSSATAAFVKQIMLNNGQRYTSSIPGYTLGVKSGTAQIKDGAEENSFLVGFDSNPEHPIAFCVLIEDRKSGEVTTDSIVHTLLTNLK